MDDSDQVLRVDTQTSKKQKQVEVAKNPSRLPVENPVDLYGDVLAPPTEHHIAAPRPVDSPAAAARHPAADQGVPKSVMAGTDLVLGAKSPAFRALCDPLPQGSFAGTIVVVEARDASGAERACQLLRKTGVLGGRVVLGLDTETKPSFRAGAAHPVCLIQLATAECAVLFRLEADVALLPALQGLLADSKVVKCGIELTHELAGLARHRERGGGVAGGARGLVEMAPLCSAAGCRSLSLRGLAAAFLGLRVPKV